MDIRVIFQENSAGLVSGHRLQEMIDRGEVVAFWRSGEWVSVKDGAIRRNPMTDYAGPERRMSGISG